MAVGVIVVPLYIKYMGAEAYGLVGFFAMLQAWFNMLDMGLTPTTAREAARFHGGAMDALSFRRVIRALEGFFFAIALLGAAFLFFNADWIATRWLNVGKLEAIQAVIALKLMAPIIALRWMCGLYRGVITGAEKLVWLSGFNSVVATFRSFLTLPVLIFISATPLAFFIFQLGIAIFEILILAWVSYRLLPIIPSGQRIRWQWAPLRPLVGFSLSAAFTASVWMLVTQTDKLILSRILSLSDYGYFTVAVLIASGITLISGPISGAIMPRMVRLQAEAQDEKLIIVYRQATKIVAVIVIPVALILIFFSRQILWAWTGEINLVEKIAPVLTLYAAGYGILAVGAFPYYLQYAKGNLRLHLIGSLFFLFLLIPSVIWASVNHGMAGAGWAWFLSNFIYFIIWVPMVHRRFAKGMHKDWIFHDILKSSWMGFFVVVIAYMVIPESQSRFFSAVQLVLLLIGSIIFSCCTSGIWREAIVRKVI